jgi:hypothetical protein
MQMREDDRRALPEKLPDRYWIDAAVVASVFGRRDFAFR